MNYIYKILRFSAWVLVALTPLTLWSGFLASKPLLFTTLSMDTYRQWHLIILPLLFMPLFYLHSLTGIIIFLNRHEKTRNQLTKITVGALWTLIIFSCVYLFLAKAPITQVKNISDQNNSNSVAIALTATEIAKHNSTADCWLIINNNVYDVSVYLNQHPGGRSTIAPYCGQEATQAFDTKNTGAPHSDNAQNLLSSFYLGQVGSQINTQQIDALKNQPVQNFPGNEQKDD